MGKDTSNNWYNIIKTGWGPSQGFAISPDYNETTEVYVISNQAGRFKIVIDLVDVSNNNKVIKEVEKYYTLQ